MTLTERYAKALISIALSSCCEGCQEAAMKALDWHVVPDASPSEAKGLIESDADGTDLSSKPQPTHRRNSMDQVKAFVATLEKLSENGMADCRYQVEGCEFDHFVDMYNRIVAADPPFSEAKKGRWLGWMQGAATAMEFLTLEEAKEINKRFAG